MKKIILLLAAIITLVGCSNNLYEDRSEEDRYKIANKFFAQEKYRRAIPIYESIVTYKTSGFTSQAQAKVAECYFLIEDYVSALAEYEILKKYSSSLQDLEIAYYRIAICNWNISEPPQYTQEETIAAINAASEYLERYPTGKYRAEARKLIKDGEEKLLIKKYENGYISYKLSDYPAALMYFNGVLEQGITHDVDAKSAYYAAKIYHYWEKNDKANGYMQYLKSMYPKHKYTKKAFKEIKVKK